MIGFFDSGIGGLSVWREAIRVLPQESTIYLSDNAFCPYGHKPPDEIIGRCQKITDFLLSRHCSIIVVACNTATADAIDFLRSHYHVPFVGMEPAVKPAALASVNHRIGVLATHGTLHGRLYRETSHRYAQNTDIIVQEVEGWVERVESGKTAPTEETLEIVRDQLRPLLDAGADSLVLGCTHFPFLREAITQVAGPKIKLYDPASAIARRIQLLLRKTPFNAPTESKGKHLFFATGSTEPLARFGHSAQKIILA